MNRKDLHKKRFVPCFNEIYTNSQCCIPVDRKFDYDYVIEHSPHVYERCGNPLFQTLFPFECFFMDHKEMLAIIQKHTKGLHGFWYYPYKFGNLDNENWRIDDEANGKILYDFRHFEDQVGNDKTLNPYQRRKKIKERALKDGFQWRIYDAESISSAILLGPAPSSNKEHVEKMGVLYKECESIIAENVHIFKPWKKAVNDRASYLENEQAIHEEAVSFRSLVEEVQAKYEMEYPDANTSHKLDSDIEHVVSLWLILNVL